jgi:hypothetical protein
MSSLFSKRLQMIPNPYLHFGDFDYAGLNIYFNEYRKHLKSKARFFVPPGIENLIAAKGNRENYSNQTIQFDGVHKVENFTQKEG